MHSGYQGYIVKNIQFSFLEQSTEIQETTQALLKESVTDITDVHETNVKVDDVNSTEFELMALSTFHG